MPQDEAPGDGLSGEDHQRLEDEFNAIRVISMTLAQLKVGQQIRVLNYAIDSFHLNGTVGAHEQS